MTRESLRPLLFPNTALKNRIAAYEQEVEAAVEELQKGSSRQGTSKIATTQTTQSDF